MKLKDSLILISLAGCASDVAIVDDDGGAGGKPPAGYPDYGWETTSEWCVLFEQKADCPCAANENYLPPPECADEYRTSGNCILYHLGPGICSTDKCVPEVQAFNLCVYELEQAAGGAGGAGSGP
jgi:hypothetical protein